LSPEENIRTIRTQTAVIAGPDASLQSGERSGKGRRQPRRHPEISETGEPAPDSAAGTPSLEKSKGVQKNLRLFLQAGVLPVEPFHAPCGVHDFLLPRHERMTLGTDLRLNVLFGGFCLDHIPANAGNGGFLVFRMNSFLHNEPFFFLKSVADRPNPCFFTLPVDEWR
jgi:hypothetical protein